MYAGRWMYITYILYTYVTVTETKVVMNLQMIPPPQLVSVNTYLIS